MFQKQSKEMAMEKSRTLFIVMAIVVVGLLWLLFSGEEDKTQSSESLVPQPIEVKQKKKPKNPWRTSRSFQWNDTPFESGNPSASFSKKSANDLFGRDDEAQPSEENREETQEELINELEYRHSDDPSFDPGMLSGVASGYTSDFRDEFYAPKIQALLKEQMINPTGDDTEELVAQFELVIDYTLGADFSQEKREQIRTGQREAHKRGKALDAKFERGLITEDEYEEQESQNHERDLRELAEVLSNEEFETMFGYPKENIEGSYARLKALSDNP